MSSIRAFNVEHFAQNDKITQPKRDFTSSSVYFNGYYSCDMGYFPNSEDTSITCQAEGM